MTAEIICGDSAEVLTTLEEGSVELVVTSCPYDDARSYNGHLAWDFKATAKELYRVLCKGGICCWNVNDMMEGGSETLTSCEQKMFFRRECKFLIHDTMIWHKLNFSHPSLNRYHQVMEYIFVLSKGKPRCFNPIKDKKNAQAGMIGTIGRNTYQKRDGSRNTRDRYVTKEFGMRGNVWKGKTAGQERMGKSLPHPAMMPKWLARDLIISFSNKGELVIDPFCGFGTSCVQALEQGRNTIGIDIDPNYCALAQRAIDRVEPMIFV